MKKKLCLIIVVCMIISIMLPVMPVLADTQATYYISPTGNDSTGNGTIGNPWQTIQKARDVVRTINSNMTGDIIVYLRGGTYSITSTISFTSSDSGTNGYNVMYKAYSNEKPVISGGKTITNWSVHSGSIYEASVSASDDFRQIYVDSVRGTRARSTGALPGYSVVSGGYTTTDSNMQYWGNKSNIEFVLSTYGGGWLWIQHRLLVEDITGTYVDMQDSGWDIVTTTSVPLMNMQYIENAYELLDQPGEWYLDKTADTLYYIPRDGENMATAVVEVPVVEELVDISGTLGTTAHNIQFNGIDFKLSNWTNPSSYGLLYWQNNQYFNTVYECNNGPHYMPPACVNLIYAKSIRFDRCNFSKLGSQALNFLFGSQDNIINRCTFFDIAGTPIQLGGILSDYYHPDNAGKILKNNDIINNYFEKGAQDYMGGVGIFAAYTEDTNIDHNEICDFPYTGISVGAFACGHPVVDDPANPTPSKEAKITNNYVHDVMKDLGDGAPIYTNGAQPDSVCSGNYIADSSAYIYHDEGTAYYTTSNNVVDRSNSSDWLFIHASQIEGGLTHDITVDSNYTTSLYYTNQGTDCTVTNTIVKSGDWPLAALEIMNNAGVKPDIADDFENDIVGQTPSGYSVYDGDCLVSSTRGYSGSKSLRIYDNSSSQIYSVAKTTMQSTSKSFEAMIYPVSTPNWTNISIHSGSNDNDTSIFHIDYDSNGALWYYNGSSWIQFGANGTITHNVWNRLRIDAKSTTSAKIYVNNTLVGTISNWHSATTMDRVRFSSGSTADTGVDYYVDDVCFDGQPENFETGTVGNVPAGYTQINASCTVSSTQAYSGTKSLRIYDTSVSDTSAISKVSNAEPNKTFEAMIYPVNASNWENISIHNGSNDNDTSIFHIDYDSNGGLYYYDGSWHQFGANGTITMNAWNRIKIVAESTTSAKVYVNYMLVGTISNWHSASTMDRVRISSGSSAGTGDDYYVDDIIFP